MTTYRERGAPSERLSLDVDPGTAQHIADYAAANRISFGLALDRIVAFHRDCTELPQLFMNKR